MPTREQIGKKTVLSVVAPRETVRALKRRAEGNHRSASGEALSILERALFPERGATAP